MSYTSGDIAKFGDEDECASPSPADGLLPSQEGQKWAKTRSCGRTRIGILCLIAHACGWLFALILTNSHHTPRYYSGDDANLLVPQSMISSWHNSLLSRKVLIILVNSELVRFSFETDAWVPGPNDPNVTDAIFENWTNMLPRRCRYPVALVI